LERLLIAKGHTVERDVAVMVYFRGEPLAYERMDMVVDGKVIIENKAREPLDAPLPLPLRFGRPVHCRFPSMLPL
jgi:hypothetical protein